VWSEAQCSVALVSVLISSTEAKAVDDGEKQCISDDMKTTRDGLPVVSAVALSVWRRTKAMRS